MALEVVLAYKVETGAGQGVVKVTVRKSKTRIAVTVNREMLRSARGIMKVEGFPYNFLSALMEYELEKIVVGGESYLSFKKKLMGRKKRA